MAQADCRQISTGQHYEKVVRHTSFASIIFAITSPERYCSLVKPPADAKGTAAKAAARVVHFIFEVLTANRRSASEDDPRIRVQDYSTYMLVLSTDTIPEASYCSTIGCVQSAFTVQPCVPSYRRYLPNPNKCYQDSCRSIDVVVSMYW